MDSENLSDIHPLFCTDESYYVCLWIKGAIVYGAFGTTQIQGSQVLTLGQWHNVIFRYSQECMLQHYCKFVLTHFQMTKF